jgi:hypothetical protein
MSLDIRNFKLCRGLLKKDKFLAGKIRVCISLKEILRFFLWRGGLFGRESKYDAKQAKRFLLKNCLAVEF